MSTEPIDVTAEEQPPETMALEMAKAQPVDPVAQAPKTAAQAKVEAVANLTFKAYERASMLSLTPEETKALQAEFPDSAFQTGAGGKEHLIYIEHAALRDRLNQVVGPGQWAIIPRSRWSEEFKTAKGMDASRVYVEAMLLVRGAFVAEAVGDMTYYPHNDSQNYGDAVEGAKSAALRRCCKELGIGLQAWRKDFCEGWWARKRGGRDFSKPSTTAPQQQAASAPAPKPEVKADKFPTEATREWMLKGLNALPGMPMRDLVNEFFIKAGKLLPDENPEAISLLWVANSKEQLAMLSSALIDFEAGGEAVWPYPAHKEQIVPKVQTEPTKTKVAPAEQPNPNDLWWKEIIVPVPRKGQKRADYLTNPDTIGSLYDARHGNDEESQAMRQRLWGFLEHYQPAAWVGRDGKSHPASKDDIEFRRALDACKQYHAQNHPGEKL